MQPQWHANGNGMAHARLRLVGRHHHDFAQIFYGFHQVVDARRGNAIIIGNNITGCSFVIDIVYSIQRCTAFKRNQNSAKRLALLTYNYRFIFK